MRLQPGLAVAIEPCFLAGGQEAYRIDDDWTLRSADGSRGSHFEHTIAVTECPLSSDLTHGAGPELWCVNFSETKGGHVSH